MPRQFFSRYTHDLTSDELGKLFTRETPEAYRFFARGINTAELEGLPFFKRCIKYAQGFFLAVPADESTVRPLLEAETAWPPRAGASHDADHAGMRRRLPESASPHALRPITALEASARRGRRRA